MDFKVFLSYSAAPEEQALVWRLQTLATAEGIEMYVPPRAGVRLPSTKSAPFPPIVVRKQIDSCDCVLAILATGLTAEVQQELNYALGKDKTIVPIVAENASQASYFNKFPLVCRYSPWTDVGEIESKVVNFLKQKMRDKAQRQALGALVGIGLGLLLLSAATKK